ncbi:hypothetical protein ABH925_005721 [Streptacidiphilus sp. EB129]
MRRIDPSDESNPEAIAVPVKAVAHARMLRPGPF